MEQVGAKLERVPEGGLELMNMNLNVGYMDKEHQQLELDTSPPLGKLSSPQMCFDYHLLTSASHTQAVQLKTYRMPYVPQSSLAGCVNFLEFSKKNVSL